MEKKRVLIYGDSNTHGYRVSDGLRYGKEQRWTGICQKLTADWTEILEEGLNGRTTHFEEPFMEFRSGISYIQPCVRTHLPLDMVCVMLGSNDLKKQFHQDAEKIAKSAAEVLERSRRVVHSKYPDSPCLYTLISPPPVGLALIGGPFGAEFDGEEAVRQSARFPFYYKREAEKRGFLFFDAAEVCGPCGEDGLHLDPENHQKLGIAFADWLGEIWK